MAPRLSTAPAFPLPVLPPELFKEPADREAVRRFNEYLAEWHVMLNGGIVLGTGAGFAAGHIDGEIVKFTSLSAAVDFPVNHNLGRIPVGVIQLVSNSAVSLSRAGATPAHTATQLWFRTAAPAGTVYEILVF